MNKVSIPLTVILITVLSGCGQPPIRLINDSPSSNPAVLKGVNRFYLLGSKHCEITQIDGEYLEKLGIEYFGNRVLEVDQKTHELSIYCVYTAINAGFAYYGKLSFMPQAGHTYTIDIVNSRKCIVMVDSGSGKEIDADCSLTRSDVGFGSFPRF